MGEVHVKKSMDCGHFLFQHSFETSVQSIKLSKLCPSVMSKLPITISLCVVKCTVGIDIRVGAISFNEAVAAIQLHGTCLELVLVNFLGARAKIMIHHAMLDETVGPVQVPAEAPHVGVAIFCGDALFPTMLLLSGQWDLPAIEGRLAEHGVRSAICSGRYDRLVLAKRLQTALQHAAASRAANLRAHAQSGGAAEEQGRR
mmetsp:Transcript_105063/g.306997  ORF Transcript_105063/g.306997 Transcript_105063/m.306997 type:complete len:201 (-) Transcript_105063:119-721(-)